MCQEETMGLILPKAWSFSSLLHKGTVPRHHTAQIWLGVKLSVALGGSTMPRTRKSSCQPTFHCSAFGCTSSLCSQPLGSLSGPSLWTNLSLLWLEELDISVKRGQEALGTKKFKRGRAGGSTLQTQGRGCRKTQDNGALWGTSRGRAGKKKNVKWTFRDSIP